MGVSGGAPLPYDAEIEYLEGTGTQYINLGNLGESNKVTFDLMFELSAKENNRTLLGGRASTNTRFCWVLAPGANDEMQVGYGASFTNLSLAMSVGDICKIATSISNNRIYYNLYNETQGTATSTYFTLSTFATTDVLLFWNGVLNKAKVKVRSLVVYNEGDTTHDFIPVRVGQVGHMYDRVGGQLYGNSGTGDFVLGPDKN